MVGYDNVIFGDGITSSKGTHGIMAGDSRLPPASEATAITNTKANTHTKKSGSDDCKGSKGGMLPPPDADTSPQ